MASTNPLIAQGTLNRLRASVIITNFPALNVTSPYLGEDGISINPDGESTTYIKTLTGAVTSPEPYQQIMVEVHLLRTQGLANQYKLQIEASSLLGPIVVRPDSSALSAYDFVNCSIQGWGPHKINGKDAGFMVKLGGYYLINQDLYNS
jgi:hypothetical protein